MCFSPYLGIPSGGEGGGGVSQGIGTQLAYAVFHPRQLKNRSFRTLHFWHCDHLKWPSQLSKACFRPYLRVVHPIWVLGPGGGGGGGSQGIGTQPAYAAFHLGQLKNWSFRRSFFWYRDHLKWPRYVKHVLGRIYVFFTLFGYYVGGGGGSPKGLVHNLLMQFFTLGTSKIEVFEPYILDIVTT